MIAFVHVECAGEEVGEQAVPEIPHEIALERRTVESDEESGVPESVDLLHHFVLSVIEETRRFQRDVGLECLVCHHRSEEPCVAAENGCSLHLKQRAQRLHLK